MATLTLRAKQVLFAGLAARLIQYAIGLGYAPRFGEAWRSPEEAARLAALDKGIKLSLHCDRLALDLLLDRDGVWLKKTEDYRPLGEWWERQHLLCRWGGHWGDGNHFSLTHGGRK